LIYSITGREEQADRQSNGRQEKNIVSAVWSCRRRLEPASGGLNFTV